jgi:hypothetical protein
MSSQNPSSPAGAANHVYTIPAPVTAARPTPASIVVRQQPDGSATATAPVAVEYAQLVGSLAARFGNQVGQVTGHDGAWTVAIHSPVIELEAAA